MNNLIFIKQYIIRDFKNIIFQILVLIFNVKKLINFEHYLINSFFDIIECFENSFFMKIRKI